MSDESEQDPQLARLVAGELDADSAEGREALAAAGITRDALEGLRSLAAQLNEAAKLREEITTAADSIEDPPGLDRLSSTLDELTGESKRPRWGWLLPAAGLLLLLPLAFKWLQPPAEQLLGGGDITVTHVETTDGAYGPVAFESPLEEFPGTFTLKVFDIDDPVREVPLYEYSNLKSSPWSDTTEQAKWPRNVHLRIEMHQPGLSDLPSGWLEVSLD